MDKPKRYEKKSRTDDTKSGQEERKSSRGTAKPSDRSFKSNRKSGFKVGEEAGYKNPRKTSKVFGVGEDAPARDNDRKSGERSFGDKKFSDRKFSDRKPREDRPGDRSFGDRKPRGEGFGDRKFSDRKPREDRPGDRSFGDRKPRGEGFGDRKFSDRKPREDKPGDRPFGDRKPRGEGFGDRSFGDRKPREDRPGDRSFGDRKPRGEGFGDRSFGDRKPREDRPGDRSFGDRKPRGEGFGDRKFSDRKPREDRPGDRSFGDRKPREDRPGDRSFGDRKPRGEGFGDKKFGAKKFDRSRREDDYDSDESTEFRHKSLSSSESSWRLNKYIANSGVSSRREADTIIADGKVKVNGVVVTEMGHKVTNKDKVTVDGAEVHPEDFTYILMNKPKNHITTVEDEKGRTTVMDLISDATGLRVYPVGRLDRNTTGLLLLTNDGDLANRLMHPSYKVKKTYIVETDIALTDAQMLELRQGINLDDGPATAHEVRRVPGSPNAVKISIFEGRNRQVRRMLEYFKLEVIKLHRTYYAGLTVVDVRPGRWRFLKEKEVNDLRMLVKLFDLKQK
jgi:23S rRNA pseudouridine2605 synthase